MSSPNLKYVIGNVNSPGNINERQMEAKDPTQVVVASTANSNEKKDKWIIVPAPKEGAIVSFQSKKYSDKYLGIENTAVCTADLQTIVTEFRLKEVGRDGNDAVYTIQPLGGTPDCKDKFLTMDDPQGGKGITLLPGMSTDTHKQKWKFTSAPTGDAGRQ